MNRQHPGPLSRRRQRDLVKLRQDIDAQIEAVAALRKTLAGIGRDLNVVLRRQVKVAQIAEQLEQIVILQRGLLPPPPGEKPAFTVIERDGPDDPAAA